MMVRVMPSMRFRMMMMMTTPAGSNNSMAVAGKTEAVLRAVHPDVRPAATAAPRPVVQADATHRGLAKAFVGHQHIVVQSCVVEPVCTCTVNHSSRK